MFTILGLTDDRSDCECCGKSGLKAVVALRKDDGDIVFYGRTCAAMAVHGSKSARNVRKIEDAVVKAQRDAEDAKRDAENLRQSKLERVASYCPPGHSSLKSVANHRYNRTGRPLTGSYFAEFGETIVRVDGSDAVDVAFYTELGFVQTSATVERDPLA